MIDIELDLDYAKQAMLSSISTLEAMASSPAHSPEDRQSFRDMADDLNDALAAVCLADAHVNADSLINRAMTNASGTPAPASQARKVE